MLLSRIRVVGLGVFDDLTCVFRHPEGAGLATAVFGGGGVGKTTLLAAIASTRPGCATSPPVPQKSGSRGFAIAEWNLSDDDSERPHPLLVTSPQAALDESEDDARLRRREQALFDKRAADRGYAFVAFSGARWFSRSPIHLTAPSRTVLRYDVRAVASFDDGTRADLARDTKQTLSYASIAASLAGDNRKGASDASLERAETFEKAIRVVVDRLAGLFDVRFLGADPVSLEPQFETHTGARVAFDTLPNSVRHIVSFGALTVRTIHAAYPDIDPRAGEAVALIDSVDLHQDAGVQREIIPALRDALPRVQWIVTTASPEVTLGCDPSEVVALRRMPDSHRVELFEGSLATLH